MKRPLEVERRGPSGWGASAILIACTVGFLLGIIVCRVGSCAARLMGVEL